MREQVDGDAEVQGIQGRLHVARGQGFHRDRPRETAQSSYSRSWTPGIPPAQGHVFCEEADCPWSRSCSCNPRLRRRPRIIDTLEGTHSIEKPLQKVSEILALTPNNLTITHNFRELRERPEGQVVDNKKGADDNKL